MGNCQPHTTVSNRSVTTTALPLFPLGLVGERGKTAITGTREGRGTLLERLAEGIADGSLPVPE